MLLFLLSTTTQSDLRKSCNVKKRATLWQEVLAQNNVLQAGRDTKELSMHSTVGNMLPQHHLQTMTKDLTAYKYATRWS